MHAMSICIKSLLINNESILKYFSGTTILKNVNMYRQYGIPIDE